MNRIQKELNLPLMYIVHSTPEGVDLPTSKQVIEIEKLDNSNKYILEQVGYPYEIDIKHDKISAIDNGYCTGFGDCWCWTYYLTLSKEDADKYYSKELERVTKQYLNSSLDTHRNAMKLFQESMLDNDICRKVFLLKESLKLENKAIEICKDQDADQTTILILESSKDSIKNILETFV